MTGDLVHVALRRVQSETGCSTRTLKKAYAALKPFMTARARKGRSFRQVDKVLRGASGATSMRLNGCIGCHGYVFTPQDASTHCPKCDYPRFSPKGKPNETCFYFPITTKLRQLLRLPKFQKLLRYEATRPRNRKFWTDVFDTPRWRRVMGVCDNEDRTTRIALQLCVDSFTAFAYGGMSVKPLEFILLNLPPNLRMRVQNMLLCMLIPAELKGHQARKYYDWAADFEIKNLHFRGVDGVRVVVYATSLDAPGRAELLGMQSHGAMFGCPYCDICFDPGLLTKPVYGGFRRFLPMRHPWRRVTSFEYNGLTYYFSAEELRPPPENRTTTHAMTCISLARPYRPFRGHKTMPLLSKWPSFSWDMNPSDVMHDLSSVCKMLLKVIVGKGRFGMYESWKRDEEHREFCRVMGVFPEVVAGGDLPWRLSAEEVSVVDARVGRIWWTHYMDPLCWGGYSFFKKSDRMYKSRHRSFILLVLLATMLRGYIPAVHMGLVILVSVLRQLQGQVACEKKAKEMGIRPGSRYLERHRLTSLQMQLVKGLILLEGGLPACILNPLLHRLVHYVVITAAFGLMWWFAMYAFERYNKHVKKFIRSKRLALASVESGIKMEIACRFLDMSQSENDSSDCGSTCKCYGHSRICTYVIQPRKYLLKFRTF